MIRMPITDFTMQYADYGTLPTKAPCTLYSVLCDHGKLPDVYYGTPEEAIASLPQSPVEFMAKLPLDEAILSKKKISLRFFGIDAPATVALDGELIGRVTEAGRPCVFDIEGALRRGKRKLTVTFPYDTASRSFAVPIEKWRDHGIYDRVELIAYDNAFIEEISVEQKHENDNVSLHIKHILHGEIGDLKAIAALSSPGGKMYYCGLNRGFGKLLIPDPEYWWPHTLGKPSCYRLTVTLYSGGEPIDAVTVNVGLREIRLHEIDEQGDRAFALSVMGHRFFVSGAEFGPDQLLLSRRTREHTERSLRALASAGVNYLYIREGASYLSDTFFELCDRLGILVGLDIPDDAPFLGGDEESYLSLLEGRLLHIGTHPSLALLRSGLDAMTSLREIPETISRCAPGAVSCNLRYISEDVALDAFDTSSAFAPIRTPSSFPSLRSLEAFVPRDQLNPYSLTVERRCPTRVADIFYSASERYPYATSLSQLIYLSEIHQADAMCEAITFLRLRRGRAMGSILMGATDAWGAISPSLIDFYGARKAALYALERVYAPVALLCRRDGYRVSVYVANDSRKESRGTVSCRLIDMKNGTVKEDSFSYTAPCDALTSVASVDYSTLVHRRTGELALVCTMVSDDKNASRETTVLFCEKKRLALSDPKIALSVTGSGTEYEITLCAEAFAPSVVLSLDGYDATFSRGVFDLTRNLPYRIRVSVKKDGLSAETVRRALRVMSVYSIGKEEGDRPRVLGSIGV